jgi:Flp pilus assembly protein TadG
MRGPLEDDRGVVTLMLVVFALALLLSVGLVVDGGVKLRAVQQADQVAAEAARAAAQQIDVAGVQAGGAPRLRTADAAAAGQAVLAAAGATGAVAPRADGSVEVTASITRPTVFLGLVGVAEVTGSGRATADLEVRS